MVSTGKGFGKTILFGEHFVVYGLPAIAAALGDYTEAKVEVSKKFELIDNRPETPGYKETKKEEIQREIGALIKHFNLDVGKNPIKITLSGNLVCASGIGASACLAASISRALNEHLKLNLNDDEINEAAFFAESAGSGPASGIDNTCAVFGGFIVFEKNLIGGKNKIEMLELKEPVEIVLANSGITQETKNVVGDVKFLMEQNPKDFEKIFADYKAIFEKAVLAIKENDLVFLGKLMNENHSLLQKITVSCKELDEMQKIALDAGAFGAKLTGTGRGGLMIALTPGKALQEKVSKALEAKGFKTTKTKIGRVP